MANNADRVCAVNFVRRVGEVRHFLHERRTIGVRNLAGRQGPCAVECDVFMVDACACVAPH